MTTVLEPHAADAAAHAARIYADVLEQAVTIALAGGPDQTAPDWQTWGSCRTSDVDQMYEGGHTKAGKELLRRCRDDCAVQAECLGAALGNGERDGIWGGTTMAGRQRLRVKLREAGLLGVVGEDAYVAWRDDGADREPVPPPARKTIDRPWPHQAAAVAAIVDEISDGGTCQIAMATASGKTHVAMWAAHALAADTVAVLMPSLSLITQTAALWAADPAWADVPMLAVCSDPGQGGLEATTDPARVAEFAAAGRGVVLATYQSSEVLVDAGARFDLIVADEAHHLAGDPEKAYATVVRGEIPTDRTLYMTATPRRYRRRRANPDVDLVSMDDPAHFGRRVFDFTLSDAIDAGVVADYRVIIAAVDRATFDQVAAHPDLVDVDPHLLAGAIAVVEAMGQQRLTSCVSFHTKVERARRFSLLVGQVAELLPHLRPDGPGWAGFVHGAASVGIRERLLTRLADTRTWGVLANAKALGEGVDLPSLDAVAIVDPKNSETDVLQATGRALRLSGDKVGTVLLPVLLSASADTDDPLGGLDERSVDVVSGVLRALRAHDTDLGARLDHTRRGMARISTNSTNRGLVRAELGQLLRKQAARGLLRSRVEFHLPGGALGDLAGAMALHLVREATASWDEAYGRLEAWTAEHGHCRIPQSTDLTMTEGTTSTLGAWVSRQRTLHKRGLLADERITALERLTGWTWNARDEAWWAKFDVFEEFVRTHGRYPTQFEEWHDVKVGNFLWGIRAGVKPQDNEWLTRFPDRVAAIEALPGWTWDPRSAWWEEHFAQLARWAATYGHAAPVRGCCAEDGFDLGAWVLKERGKIRDGRRTPDQAARLRALPGWVDDFRDELEQQWTRAYAALVSYVDANGGGPPQSHVEPDGFKLGAWMSKQRQVYAHPEQKGLLTPERIARLEAVPGWSWAPHDDAWRRAFETLRTIAPDRRNSDGEIVLPMGQVDGINLGSWGMIQRQTYRAGRLSAERVALLESIDGWVWEPRSGQRIATAV